MLLIEYYNIYKYYNKVCCSECDYRLCKNILVLNNKTIYIKKKQNIIILNNPNLYSIQFNSNFSSIRFDSIHQFY